MHVVGSAHGGSLRHRVQLRASSTHMRTRSWPDPSGADAPGRMPRASAGVPDPPVHAGLASAGGGDGEEGDHEAVPEPGRARGDIRLVDVEERPAERLDQCMALLV